MLTFFSIFVKDKRIQEIPTFKEKKKACNIVYSQQQDALLYYSLVCETGTNKPKNVKSEGSQNQPKILTDY